MSKVKIEVTKNGVTVSAELDSHEPGRTDSLLDEARLLLNETHETAEILARPARQWCNNATCPRKDGHAPGAIGCLNRYSEPTPVGPETLGGRPCGDLSEHLPHVWHEKNDPGARWTCLGYSGMPAGHLMEHTSAEVPHGS